jgi:hypothetical protein
MNEIVTPDCAVRERVHPYAGEDALAPGSDVLLGGRYWLVARVERQGAHANLARIDSFDDDMNPRSGRMCRLVVAGVLQAGASASSLLL